jgi:hypothetical protein
MAARGRSDADESLALGLARGLRIVDAATAASVSERTARRRMDDPAFRRRVIDLRAGMVERTVGSLAEAATEAVTTLRELLGKDTPPAVRRSAAATILSELLTHRKENDLERRLRLLEEQEGEHDS